LVESVKFFDKKTPKSLHWKMEMQLD
jgi:hypothetical protein